MSKWSAENIFSHHFRWRTWPGHGQNSTAFWEGVPQGKEFSLHSGLCRMLIRCFIWVMFWILHWCIDRQWQKCISQPLENWTFHPTIEWPWIAKLSRNLIMIICISKYSWASCQPPSINPPYSWRTSQSGSFHKGLQFWVLFPSPWQNNQMSILGWNPDWWFPICSVQISPPAGCPGLCNADHLVHHILVTFVVFNLDGMHHTPRCRTQCFCSVVFHHCIILWIFRCTGKQLHHLTTKISSWMESRCCCNLKLESILAFIAICQHTLFLVLYWWDTSKIPQLHKQHASWPLLDGFALDVRVSYETRWIFYRFSGLSRLVFQSMLVTFPFSVCNKFIIFKWVPYVISSMTLLNVSATPGIVTTMIHTRAKVCAGSPTAGVVWISQRWRSTEFGFSNGSHSRSSPIILG